MPYVDLDALVGLAVLGYTGCALLLSLYGLHRYLILLQWWRARRQPRPPLVRPPCDWPHVTVQLPMFNERYVAERLIASICALDYPRDKLEVQVLDDSTDVTTELAAAVVGRYRRAGIDIVHLHRARPEGYKAGALQAGLRLAKGELVAIFDADFLPPADWLRRTVPHFADPAVGMVQTRWGHLNRDYSLLTRVQALLLDGHFLLEHTARHRSGRFFNFNGTAGVWRRRAIEDAGGWHHDTLTEDLDLSYRAQLAGWRFVFLPDVVAPAELPVDINGFKSQQHRWTKGSIQTARKLLGPIWRSNQALPIKIEATIHMGSNLSYLLLLALMILAFPAIWARHQYGWAAAWTALDSIFVTFAVISVLVFYACALAAVRGRWALALVLGPAVMAAGIGLALNNSVAALEALRGRISPFRRTPKYGVRAKAEAWIGKAYRSSLSGGVIVEAGLCLYAAIALRYAIENRLWSSVPFLLLFLWGFGSVTGLSCLQWLATLRRRHAQAHATV